MAALPAFPFKHGARVKVKTAGGGLKVGDIGFVQKQYQTPDATASWIVEVRAPIPVFGNHDFHIPAASVEVA